MFWNGRFEWQITSTRYVFCLMYLLGSLTSSSIKWFLPLKVSRWAVMSWQCAWFTLTLQPSCAKWAEPGGNGIFWRPAQVGFGLSMFVTFSMTKWTSCSQKCCPCRFFLGLGKGCSAAVRHTNCAGSHQLDVGSNPRENREIGTSIEFLSCSASPVDLFEV